MEVSSTQVEVLIQENLEPKLGWFNRWVPFLQWSRSSPEDVKKSEEDLLNFVKTKSEGKYVEVKMDERTHCKVWTRVFNPGVQDKSPLVMVHGMGSGLALFAMNFDQVCQDRTVYAIDLPGFARSSRCKFNSKPEIAEAQYVQAIENWRQKVGLDKFCLLGHSFGGYLSGAYSLKYPSHVSHLILADPWGFPEMPKDYASSRRFPWWVKFLYHVLFKHLNPLAGLRLAGPWGQEGIGRVRGDLFSNFQDMFETEEENKRIISAYIYHCNVHKPTGESAFHSLMKGPAFAKFPMLTRMKDLDKQVPLTALYGEQSWIKTIPVEEFLEARGAEAKDSYTKVEIISNAGHHVYANPKEFNYQVLKACQVADESLSN